MATSDLTGGAVVDLGASSGDAAERRRGPVGQFEFSAASKSQASNSEGLTGAWLADGCWFGDLADTADVDRLGCADPTLHVRVGTVAEPLAPLAAALLAAAGQPVSVAIHVFGRVALGLGTAEALGVVASAGAAMTDCVERALCWLMFRRQSYGRHNGETYDGDSGYLLDVASQRWIALTDAYLLGGAPSSLAHEFPEAMLPAGAWTEQTVLLRRDRLRLVPRVEDSARSIDQASAQVSGIAGTTDPTTPGVSG